MTHDSAPHERVFAGDPGPYSSTYRSDCVVSIGGVVVSNQTDWPDDDGPVTATERWALAIMRKIPFGQVTVCSRDGEIERLQVNLTLKPGESWPA